MSGTAYGGGIGDALVAHIYAPNNATNEDNFSLRAPDYSMTCSGGGFRTDAFASGTVPPYAVCVKTQESTAATQWSAVVTAAPTVDMTRVRAFVSKGQPLRASVFNTGSIVLGLDAAHSEGVPFGTCR